MAYNPHTLLSFGGDLYAERWNCNLRFSLVGSDLEANLTRMTAVLKAAFSTGDYTDGLTLDTVKLNEIGPDGRYTEPVTHQRVLLGTARGKGASTSAANRPIPQAAIVATLLTDVGRGHASKGRIYLPGHTSATSPAADGRMAAGVPGAIANTVAGMINDLNTAYVTTGGDFPGRCSVFSKIDGSEHPVTGVAVGRVIDTQRRRRASLVEAREASTVAITG